MESNNNNPPKLLQKSTVISSNGDKAIFEVYDNGGTAVTKLAAKKGGGWGGGGGGGGPTKRTCSGSCGGATAGPIDCPEGQSPSLDCSTNPPTISCGAGGPGGTIDVPILETL